MLDPHDVCCDIVLTSQFGQVGNVSLVRPHNSQALDPCNFMAGDGNWPDVHPLVIDGRHCGKYRAMCKEQSSLRFAPITSSTSRDCLQSSIEEGNLGPRVVLRSETGEKSREYETVSSKSPGSTQCKPLAVTYGEDPVKK